MSDEEAFGAGPKLTQNFDFEVNNTGDIETNNGLDQLEQDLGFNTRRRLQDRLGSIMTNTEKQLTENRARRVFEDDPRIQSVMDMSIRETGTNELSIDAIVYASNEETYDFIITVGDE